MRTHYIFWVANNANNYHKSSAPASDAGLLLLILLLLVLLLPALKLTLQCIVFKYWGESFIIGCFAVFLIVCIVLSVIALIL